VANTIGASGGTVTTAGGQARLEIPPGALASDVALSIRPTAAVPLDPLAVDGAAFEVTPPVSFATPVRLVIRAPAGAGPSGVDPVELRVHALAGGRWEPIGSDSGFEASSREAFAQVSATGVFGVRWPGPAEPCSGAEHRQFDFWLGSWIFEQVLPPSNGTGTNEIARDDTGCLVLENFRDAGQGASVSLVSPLDGLWHQTYIDTQGQRLILVGAFEGDRMVLAVSATQRFVWLPLEPGRIRYFGERTTDGTTWSVFFDSFYTAPP